MKILILRLSSLGDIVLTQPVAAWLRHRYPEAQIDFVTKEQFSELVSLMACGLNPVSYKKSLAFHRYLRHQRYDLILDLHGKLSSLLILLAAWPQRYAIYNKSIRKRRQIVGGNRTLRIDSTVELYKSALDKLFPDVSLAVPRLVAPKDVFLPPLPKSKKLIAIFPGAAHETKRYPAKYYKELIKASPNHHQYIILGSTEEQDLAFYIAQGSSALNFCGKLKLGELLAMVDGCDWVISSDSGPMHIAAALQKKQIAIFGATHPRLGFAPQNPHANLLVADLDCQPCSLHGDKQCPLGHFRCMHSISARTILDIMLSEEGAHQEKLFQALLNPNKGG
jgi:ADP-heptose:LPS heptosyltransferase